jgi:small subunit ribosomal protein S7
MTSCKSSETSKVRISGTTQLVPSIIETNRQETLAICWMLKAATKQCMNRKSMSLDQCLYDEILDASQKMGIARKRRDDLCKLAQANRSFLHCRWCPPPPSPLADKCTLWGITNLLMDIK